MNSTNSKLAIIHRLYHRELRSLWAILLYYIPTTVSDNAKAKPIYTDITSQNNIARSISKEIRIKNNINKCVIVFGIVDISVLYSLINDFNMNVNGVNISKITTKNGCLYKLNLNNNYLTVVSILKPFSILRKNNYAYSNIYIRPCQSYDDRMKLRILTLGASNKPGNIKCVFNNHTLNYELRTLSLNDERIVIECNSIIEYIISDNNKWKLLLDNNNKSSNNSFTSSNIVINNN